MLQLDIYVVRNIDDHHVIRTFGDDDLHLFLKEGIAQRSTLRHDSHLINPLVVQVPVVEHGGEYEQVAGISELCNL